MEISNDIRISFIFTQYQPKKQSEVDEDEEDIENGVETEYKKRKELFYFWFHTSFERGPVFSLAKAHVDGTRKSKDKKVKFTSNFRVDTFMI